MFLWEKVNGLFCRLLVRWCYLLIPARMNIPADGPGEYAVRDESPSEYDKEDDREDNGS